MATCIISSPPVHSDTASYLLSYLNQKNGTVGFPLQLLYISGSISPQILSLYLKNLNQIIHNCIAAAKQSSVSQPKLGFHAMLEVFKSS